MTNQSLRLCAALAVALTSQAFALDIQVSPTGSDNQQGTAAAPVRTLEAARKLARAHAGREPVTIILADGIYYCDKPLVLANEDSGRAGAPVVYRAAHEGKAPCRALLCSESLNPSPVTAATADNHP